MSLAELLPLVEALPREEKIQLRDALDADLKHEEPAAGEVPAHLIEMLRNAPPFAIHSPYDSYEAAFILQELLKKGEVS